MSQKYRNGITLNGHQLRNALHLIAPDGTNEQLEQEVVIEWMDKGPPDDDDNIGEAGYYAWDAEYPEEGCIPLSDKVSPDTQARAARSDAGDALSRCVGN